MVWSLSRALSIVIEHDGTAGSFSASSISTVIRRSASASIVLLVSSRYFFASSIAVCASLRASCACAVAVRHALIACARGVPQMVPFAYRAATTAHTTNTTSTVICHHGR